MFKDVYFDIQTGYWKLPNSSKMTFEQFLTAMIQKSELDLLIVQCEYNGFCFVIYPSIDETDMKRIKESYEEHCKKLNVEVVKEKPKDTMRELAESYYKFYKTLIKSGFTSEQAFELLKMYVRS